MALKINNTNYAPIVLDLSTKELVDGTITSIETNATTISPYAFFNCTELVSVVAANATSVGENAFYGCSKLETVDLRNCVTIGNNAFNGCTKLKTIIVSDKLTSCASNLLGNTVSRKVIFISDNPAKWTQINFTKEICSLYNSYGYTLYFKDSRFPSLTESVVSSIELTASMTSINTYSLHNIVGLETFSAIYDNTIPAGALTGDNITRIHLSDNGLDCVGKYFSTTATYQTQNNTKANNITRLRMYSDVKNDFCYGLTNLARVELVTDDWNNAAGHTETIGTEAFMGCTGLSMLTLPNTLHTIGNDAFKNCFTNATTYGNSSNGWYQSIIYIGSQYSTSTTYGWGKIAFGNEYSNPAYVAKNSNTTVPSTIRTYNTYHNYSVGSYGYINYSYFTEYVSSNNTVTANIDDYAFYGQSNLATVDLSGGNITSIGTYAFAYAGVSTLTIGSNIDRIPSYCFLACPITSSITIGSNITEVEPYAFGTGGVSNLPYIASITIDDAFLNANTNKIWYNSFSRANVTSVTTPNILALKTFIDHGIGGYESTGNWLFGYDDNLNTNDFKNVHSIYITTSALYGRSGNTYMELERFTFADLTQLTSLSIPNFGSISTWSITGCTRLTEMTYRGTSSEFIAALKKYVQLNGGTSYNTNNAWINAFMSNAGALTTIHCTDTDLTRS